ncbi:hypothetical protein SAMD00019534_003600 [Acytostelium subglobosum LB1]|uniref:hypothetical protein n=1 Tax=Acytostelium subglobosum LB1 TaxID=1410327 RepID=UPI00064519CC|nr:hypothetical protein SAMD00019534_003600 [Acytostelium subglobosum LB1]GAM17185.1 hypothetical protein SAMD00019534_003600 [Acytostelium subglobosum LB1]|eukprot:XP_012759247.1 hypothetical protein SAMD00019534_003600 [Acytostelium subglobosum LB1]
MVSTSTKKTKTDTAVAAVPATKTDKPAKAAPKAAVTPKDKDTKQTVAAKTNDNNDKKVGDKPAKQSQKPKTATTAAATPAATATTTTTTTTTDNKNEKTTKQKPRQEKTKAKAGPKKDKTKTVPETKKENGTAAAVAVEAPATTPAISDVQDIYNKASKLYTDRCESYLRDFKKRGNKDDQWREKLQHTGTTNDRVSSITLLIQQAPMFRLSSLDILLTLVQKKSQRERELALTTLKDLFVGSLLPDNKLKRFIDRKPVPKDAEDDDLVQWFFEDLLKSRYTMFIQTLEKLARDTDAKVRIKAVQVIHTLLIKKPEQEDVLLALLVNKLGDNERKNASKVPELMGEVLREHPGMKLVVVKEVEQFLYRSNVSHISQFNAMRLLANIHLSEEEEADKEVAAKLISIYLMYFNLLVTKRQINSTIIATILRGIRKVITLTSIPIAQFEDQLDSIFMVSHHASLNKAIMTLALIYEMKKTNENISDRYYKALYELMSRREFIGQFDQTPLINLLYKSIKNDSNNARSMALIKRTLQFASLQKTSFVVGTLLLVSTLVQHNQELGNLISKPATATTKTEGEDNADSKNSYDPIKRDPQFANADTSCLWELNMLKDHFNPSVQIFSETLLKRQPISFKGNPSVTFTLPAFLEKFVVSNPSNKVKSNGGLTITDASKQVVSKFKDALPDDQYFRMYHDGAPANPVGLKTKRKGFVDDEDEFEQALRGAMAGMEGGRPVETFAGEEEEHEESDIDGEYSYSDLEADDFEEDEETFTGEAKKKKRTAPGEVDEDDGDDDDIDDDLEDDDELVEEEDDDEMIDHPDMLMDGEDDDEIDGDGLVDDDEDDDMELPDFDEDDLVDDDEIEDDEEEKGRAGKKRKSTFMDAEEFERMLESHQPAKEQWDGSAKFKGRGGRGGRSPSRGGSRGRGGGRGGSGRGGKGMDKKRKR